MIEIGKKIIRSDEVTSTNEMAKEYIAIGAGEGTVIAADVQTRGKGRLERTWESPKGGLWLSIILKPGETLAGDKLGVLPLMAGCAVANAIGFLDVEARVKWPNDVTINGKKVCGILSQSFVHHKERYVIIGIGINVNNKVQSGYEFSRVSTSLIEETGQQTEIELVEQALLSEMNRLYKMMKEDSQLVLAEWRKMAETLGKKVSVNTPSGEVTGKAVDMDENGALLLEMEDGVIVTITVGDCIHRD